MRFIQFTGNNLAAIMDFLMQPVLPERSLANPEFPEVQLTTEDGTLTARAGDWIVETGGSFRAVSTEEMDKLAPVHGPALQ